MSDNISLVKWYGLYDCDIVRVKAFLYSGFDEFIAAENKDADAYYFQQAIRKLPTQRFKKTITFKEGTNYTFGATFYRTSQNTVECTVVGLFVGSYVFDVNGLVIITHTPIKCMQN